MESFSKHKFSGKVDFDNDCYMFYEKRNRNVG